MKDSNRTVKMRGILIIGGAIVFSVIMIYVIIQK